MSALRDSMSLADAKAMLVKIRALTDDDGPECSMGAQWVLGQVREILDGPDTVPRAPGCECHLEAGDSPCRVHGEDDHPRACTFEDAWKLMEAKGYRYGGDALENVRLGYEMAINKGKEFQ